MTVTTNILTALPPSFHF